MFRWFSDHTVAVLQALFVTFLWSTSWIVIKIGLEDIPALTYAGLRYSLAFLCLLPFLLRPGHRIAIRSLSPWAWTRLFVLGIVFYAVTQGAQFVGLAYLPAATVNLLLSFTTVVVVFMSILLLAEPLRFYQWIGVGLSLLGGFVYFYPVDLPAHQLFGLIVVLVGVFANASSAVLGRYINRDASNHPLVVTTISMGVGAFLLLTAGVWLQGMPPLSLQNWILVLWLAVVNTAFAFTLWNRTLRTLTATQSSVINSTMLVQIPSLAWIFLGEHLTGQEIIGLAVAGVGALIVQLRRA